MRKGWKEIKLSDYYDVRSGLSKSAKEFGFGKPFLTFSEVFHNFFVPEKLTQLVNSSEKEQINNSIRKGDIFLTRTSEKIEELGMSCVALKDFPQATFNGFTKRLRPITKEIDSKFIGFYLRSTKFRSEITAYSSLTTRASLNNDIIGRLKVLLPPLPTQRKIASILSAYDDLIENNLKRIKLLEEKAQLTYEEWFVRMKFPGHEKAIWDEESGLPEGWSIKKLNEITQYIGRGSSPKYVLDNGHIIINQKCIRNNKVDLNLARLTSKEKKINGDKILKSHDILINSTGTGTLGRVAQIIKVEGMITIDTHVTIVRASLGLSKMFLGRALEFQEDKIASLGKGATNQIELSRHDLGEIIQINTPTIELQNAFEKQMLTIYSSIQVLGNQNQLLKEARDLLLPRLMMGLLDVEDLLKKPPLNKMDIALAAEPEVVYNKT